VTQLRTGPQRARPRARGKDDGDQADDQPEPVVGVPPKDPPPTHRQTAAGKAAGAKGGKGSSYYRKGVRRAV
jgi:hypothetical protein